LEVERGKNAALSKDALQLKTNMALLENMLQDKDAALKQLQDSLKNPELEYLQNKMSEVDLDMNYGVPQLIPEQPSARVPTSLKELPQTSRTSQNTETPSVANTVVPNEAPPSYEDSNKNNPKSKTSKGDLLLLH